MTSTRTTETQHFEETAMAAIRARVPDGEFVALADIEAELPGTYWQRTEAITRLHESGVIDIVKIAGSPLLSIPWDGWSYSPKPGRSRTVLVA